jgi:hypothetical protein
VLPAGRSVLWPLLTAGHAAAPTPDRHLALADSLSEGLMPEAALQHYQHVIAAGTASHAAYWRAAGGAIDVARQITETGDRARRDSLQLPAQACPA